MSGFSNVMKGGWHPEGKGGKKESWRNDFKGINQVAGWMGKGKDPNESDKSEHVARPLSSLKDPGSFAPPPKHINYHGAAAVPNQTTPDRSGIGAPLSQTQVNQQNVHQQQAIEAEEEAAEKPKPPPVPYRVNTTGLSTENLPPPPVRRLDSPSSGSSANTAPSAKPKPSLPPRVPPRNSPLASQDDAPPPAYTPVAPSPSDGYINQEATSRLANAGVSVPALGIGESKSTSQTQSANTDAPVNELQSRFSNMQTDTGSRSAPPPPPARSSTLQSAQAFRERHADKIDAGKQKLGGVASRVGTFVDDRRSASATPNAPSPASTLPPRDAEDALPPAQGFRERHADKIDMGKQKLGGVTSRINTMVEDRKFSNDANKRIPRPPGPNSPATRTPTVASSTVSAPAPTPAPAGSGATMESQARKKAPPPPPPKRADMRAAPANESPGSSAASTPPPVPLNTKPR